MNEINEMNGLGCLHCGKHLEQTAGKRKKQFCNVTCRSNFWQKKKRGTLKVIKVSDLRTEWGFKNEEDMKVPLSSTKKSMLSNIEDAVIIVDAIEVKTIFNFGDEKYLDIEKYTNFPKNKRPVNKGDAVTWDRLKKESDNEIREAWNLHKNQ